MSRQEITSASKGVAVTPSDTVDLAEGCRALYVGVAGNVTVILSDMASGVLFSNLPVGIHPIQVKRVLSTGTAATNMVALY